MRRVGCRPQAEIDPALGRAGHPPEVHAQPLGRTAFQRVRYVLGGPACRMVPEKPLLEGVHGCPRIGHRRTAWGGWCFPEGLLKHPLQSPIWTEGPQAQDKPPCVFSVVGPVDKIR